MRMRILTPASTGGRLPHCSNERPAAVAEVTKAEVPTGLDSDFESAQLAMYQLRMVLNGEPAGFREGKLCGVSSCMDLSPPLDK